MSALLQPIGETEAEPDVPGSRPLDLDRPIGTRAKFAARERYARFRALGHGIIESGRRAGYKDGSGAASKAERIDDVQDRIAFLAGEQSQLIREQRAELNRSLRAKATARNLCRVEGAKLVPDLERIEALPCEDQEAVLAGIFVEYDGDGAVKGYRYDPRIALEAAAQLRRMNGLDQPQKHDVDVDQQVNVRVVRYGDEEG